MMTRMGRAARLRQRQTEQRAALWELMAAGHLVYFDGERVGIRGAMGGCLVLTAPVALLYRDKLRREGRL